MSKYQTLDGKIINLTDNNFLAEGGEGKVYLKDNIIYKIHHELKYMPPLDKISELSTLLKHKNIIGPEIVLLDDNGTPIGYTMNYVSNNIPLPRLFTTSYRNAHGITPDSTIKLVESIQSLFKYIHSKGVIIVDANENNFLVDLSDYITPYAIDVCSYQTPHYPATAIMPSIQDHHSTVFNEYTDWFSFGILACQLFIGIHPYRGTVDGFKRNDLISRMKSNVSIWNNKTKLSAAVRPFELIPSDLMAWMIDIFEHGKRLAPPDKLGKIGLIQHIVKVINDTAKFIVSLIKEYNYDIINYSYGINTIATHSNGITIDNRYYQYQDNVINPLIYRDGKYNNIYVIYINNNELIIWSPINNKKVSVPIKIDKIINCDGRIICVNSEYIMELEILQLSIDNFVGNCKKIIDLVPGLTNIYDGVIIVNAIKSHIFILPTMNACHIVNIKNMDNIKIISAKHDKGVLVIIGTDDKGLMIEKLIRFSADYKTYDVTETYIDTGDINFTVLDNGIVIKISEDGIMELFNKYSSTELKKRVITDDIISTSMKLYNQNNRVVYVHNNKLYSISIK